MITAVSHVSFLEVVSGDGASLSLEFIRSGMWDESKQLMAEVETGKLEEANHHDE